MIAVECAECHRHYEAEPVGSHRLLCGDASSRDDVIRLMGGGDANVVVTSPPYASQRKYDESSGFTPIPPDAYGDWFLSIGAAVWPSLAKDGSVLLNIKEHCEDGQRSLYVKKLTIRLVEDAGWRLVDEFCWVDTKNGVPGTWPNRFKDAWEPVFHFAKVAARIKFHPQANGQESDGAFNYSPDNEKSNTDTPFTGARKALGYHRGVALPSNVLKIAAAGTGGHSAPYPVALPAWFIRAFSDPGDAILDPFVGSGTTIIAAHREGRIGHGMEISPTYCDVTLTRFARFTGLTPVLDATGERYALAG